MSLLLAPVFVAPSAFAQGGPGGGGEEPPPIIRIIPPFTPPFMNEPPPRTRGYAAYGAVRFPAQRNVVLTTRSVNTPPATSNYFLASFWYNTTYLSAYTDVLLVKDASGDTVAELAFASTDILLTLQVRGAPNDPNSTGFSTVSFTTKTVGNPSHGTGGPAKTIPVVQNDGVWHNIIVNAHMTGPCLTNNAQTCCLTAEFQIDGGRYGSTSSNAPPNMLAIDPHGNVSGPTYAVNGPFFWGNAASWTVGGVLSTAAPASFGAGYDPFYRGMLAELYLQLDDGGQDPPAPLLTTSGVGSVASRLINRNPLFAKNLTPLATYPDAPKCWVVTNTEPTMCHTGNPDYFVMGPSGYRLQQIQVNSTGRVGHLLLRASSDPCNTPPPGEDDSRGCQ